MTSNTTHVKNGGSWSQVNRMFVKNSGIWREVTTAWYKTGGSWVRIFGVNRVPTEYLVIGGGGGGGTSTSGWDPGGGGGGAGGYRTNVFGQTSGRNSAAEPELILQVDTAYTVTVGGGGSGGSSGRGGNGGNSVFHNITSV